MTAAAPACGRVVVVLCGENVSPRVARGLAVFGFACAAAPVAACFL